MVPGVIVESLLAAHSVQKPVSRCVRFSTIRQGSHSYPDPIRKHTVRPPQKQGGQPNSVQPMSTQVLESSIRGREVGPKST